MDLLRHEDNEIIRAVVTVAVRHRMLELCVFCSVNKKNVQSTSRRRKGSEITKKKKKQKASLPGVEPGISWFVVRRLIHWAIGPAWYSRILIKIDLLTNTSVRGLPTYTLRDAVASPKADTHRDCAIKTRGSNLNKQSERGLVINDQSRGNENVKTFQNFQKIAGILFVICRLLQTLKPCIVLAVALLHWGLLVDIHQLLSSCQHLYQVRTFIFGVWREQNGHPSGRAPSSLSNLPFNTSTSFDAIGVPNMA